MTQQVTQVAIEQESKQFTCRDCGQEFASGKGFSDHFIRAEGQGNIVGCQLTPGTVPAVVGGTQQVKN